MMKENRKLLTGILLGALVAGISVFLYMNNLYKSRLEYQQMQITRQVDLMDSVRHSNLAGLMKNVVDKIDDELKDNPHRILSEETIARIAALCYASRPYFIPEGDSLSKKKVSPERGQMLLFLTSMRLDTGSMKKIKELSSFEGADLRDADLKGIDLSRMNLNGANLKGAQLEKANLSETDLSFANLWGVDLHQAKLNEAILKIANLGWADLNETDMRKADLNGADMTSAQLRRADLRGADLHYSNFSGAFLLETNLDSVNMYSANLKRAQLRKAILSNANLTSAHLNEANLTEANMTGAQLSLANLTGANLENTELTGVIVSDKNWLDQLDDWQVTGAREIQSKYRMVEIRSGQKSQYRLEKKDD